MQHLHPLLVEYPGAIIQLLGYVVGLGDRHAQNILIDKSSAELIHIDLGVAFEQGKTLRTPEVVPFRLTRGSLFFSITFIEQTLWMEWESLDVMEFSRDVVKQL